MLSPTSTRLASAVWQLAQSTVLGECNVGFSIASAVLYASCCSARDAARAALALISKSTPRISGCGVMAPSSSSPKTANAVIFCALLLAGIATASNA